jgi:hypothetical protein
LAAAGAEEVTRQLTAWQERLVKDQAARVADQMAVVVAAVAGKTEVMEEKIL